MKLKRKITKAEFDQLSADLQALYSANGENYILDVEPDEDNGELLRAKQREQQRANENEQKAKDLQAQLDKLNAANNENDAESARRRGDVKRLEEIWKGERDGLVNTHNETVAKKDAQLQKLLIDDKAETLAKELAPDANGVSRWKALLPHIKMRLRAELDGETPAAKVVTEQGEPSTLSLDDLKKEFLSNPIFAGIVVGVNSSGSGATHNAGGGASKKPEEYSEQERVDLYNSNRAEFDRLFGKK